MKTPIPILVGLGALLLAGSAEAQTAQTYRYDAHGRLTAATTARPSSGAFASYTLDDANNRTARSNVAPPSPSVSWRLASGEALVVGRQLTSQDGRFTLKVEPSGQVVLRFGATVLWSAGTANGQSMYFRLQTSGAAALFDVPQNVLWATPAAGADATLTLQDDGNLVLKNSGGSVVWQSNTCCH